MGLFKILMHLLMVSVVAYCIYGFRQLFMIEYTKFVIVNMVIILIVIEYYNYVFHRSWFNFLKRKKNYKELLRKEDELYDKLLNTKIKYFSSGEMLAFIKKVKDFNSSSRNHIINDKLIEAKEILKEVQYKERIEELSTEKDSINDEIQELKLEKRRLENEEEAEIEDILENLDIEEETIFYKNDLSEKEVEVLKKKGFRQSNEYSIFSNQNETVLIKSVLNHSNTHIFLSYQIKELLENLDMENVQEHLTKDADITFKYKNKYYAIEIETGNLLKKKKQLKEKINYLNKKYKNRWLFVVTNKNFVSKYKKYGFTTQRSQVKKTLRKWLKTDTQ